VGPGLGSPSHPNALEGVLDGAVQANLHGTRVLNAFKGFSVASNSARQVFVGSAIKTFVLCETLRQLDGPGVVNSLSSRSLDLNASVWSVDSATFNPPNLIGQVSHRTALEAMINHSDNTGTDMSIKATVADFAAAAKALNLVKDALERK
jgi:beta-lactamase class A